jgi:hypothetical protein
MLRPVRRQCLHNLFSLPAPTPTISFRGTQAIFRAKYFHLQYPTFSPAVTLRTYSPMKMGQCSEMLAFKLQTPGNNPEESIRNSKHGDSLKSRTRPICRTYLPYFSLAQQISWELHRLRRLHSPGFQGTLLPCRSTHVSSYNSFEVPNPISQSEIG